MAATRTVTIPARDDHAGRHKMKVDLPWLCPTCGGPRGEPAAGISFDGSRRLSVDTWTNPCGHIDFYNKVRGEAQP